MKILLLILTILFFSSTLGIGMLYLMQGKDLSSQIQSYNDLESTYNIQNEQYKELQSKYNVLDKISHPKPFPSSSTLSAWAKEHTNYNSQTSYSEDALKLMDAAKEDGYWIGIAVAEKILANGKTVLQLPIYPYYTGSNLYVYNVAVVGESDLYAIDPATGTTLKLAEMLARMR